MPLVRHKTMRQLIAEGQIPLPQPEPSGCEEQTTWPIATVIANRTDEPTTSRLTHRTNTGDEIFASAIEKRAIEPNSEIVQDYIPASEENIPSMPHASVDISSDVPVKDPSIISQHSEWQNFRNTINVLPAIDEDLEDFPVLTTKPVTLSEESVEDSRKNPVASFSSRISSLPSSSSIPHEATIYTPLFCNRSGRLARTDHGLPQRIDPSPVRSPIFSGQRLQYSMLHRLVRRSASNPTLHTRNVLSITTTSNSSTYCTCCANTPVGQLTPEILKQPVLFSFLDEHPSTNCLLSSCQSSTSSNNSNTTTCPRCGSLSFVRYCNFKHLYADMRRHYAEDCIRRQILLPYVDMSTIDPVNGPPHHFITVKDQLNDSLERHRQAVYHSYSWSQTTKYYIFSDADYIIADQPEGFIPTPAMLASYRGTGSVVTYVNISSNSVIKVQFESTLEKLLRLGVSAGSVSPNECRLFYIYLKEDLKERRLWDNMMIERICLAMQLEFGWKVDSRLW